MHRELSQVNWIASESTQSRLVEEFRGPAIGKFYGLVLFVIVVLVLFKFAFVWNGNVRSAFVERVSRDRDILALTIGWAVIPAAVLAIVSFAHPIYASRYVTASAPGFALLVAFICVRVFPKFLDPSRASYQGANTKLRNRMMAVIGVAAAVVLSMSYLSSASSLQEDLQSPARYIAQHAQKGDVIALPDHAITSVVAYYLASDDRHIPLWPQLGVRQRYVEGFDLSLHPPSTRGFPRRVWLVADGSVPGVARFQDMLEHDGYSIWGYTQFNGSTLLLYYFTRPATAMFVPPSGATLSGTAADLEAVASSHGLGITKVQFVLSGGSYSKSVIGSATTGAFGDIFVFAWNTTKVPDGTYTLQSLATDGAKKTTYSPAITIKVDN